MSVIFIGNAGERLFQFGWQNNQSFWKSLAHGVNSSLPLPLGVAEFLFERGTDLIQNSFTPERSVQSWVFSEAQ